MSTIKTVGDGTFENAMADASVEMRSIATALRALVADVMPGVVEVAWETQGTAGYGVGAKKMSEQFCYIAPQTRHVNLGFYYGADLDDPDGLLEGSGKALRHIKIKSIDDASSTAVRALVERASTHLPKL